jgi:hypothetical protein
MDGKVVDLPGVLAVQGMDGNLFFYRATLKEPFCR